MSIVFDDRRCKLGEGPLWHPLREELFWFDIVGHKLLAKGREWQFDDYVSAAGWVDRNHLIVASATQLFEFNIETGAQRKLVDLEVDNPVTRSNDGRADPKGGFWIGTMGINAEPDAGAIYRYYRGEVRQLFAPITISNSICFAPCGKIAYFCDTPTKRIMSVALDADGWPSSDPQSLIDLTETGENPDGSVVDADGNIWNAQWGSYRVACYAPDGTFLRSVPVAGAHSSCPAFAGATGRMFVTTAMEGIDADELVRTPAQGQTHEVEVDAIGQLEHQVIL